ncbi:Armadillo repeat-containing protein 7 [Oryzias melastigma]|nr:Armadillo repeat-containing protein 7 [Oryzias melastigma]
MLTEKNENFIEFGMGGLCNLSMDPDCRDLILDSDGISLITNCLSNQREETVLSAITTLMNLVTPASRSQLTEPGILQCMLRFSLAESPRLHNLAAVFLQDCCTEDQVRQAQQQMQGQQMAVGIPLPKD